MRDILRKNKLSCIDSEIVQNLEEVKRFILKEGFPIIIKPNRGIGGKDIHKITNFTELSKMTIDTNTLVEKFIHYVFPEKPGILKEIKIPNDLDSLNISILKNVGDHVVNVGNTNRVLSLIYESPSYSEVSSISKKLNEIEIEVD